jgi:hypothetical protein
MAEVVVARLSVLALRLSGSEHRPVRQACRRPRTRPPKPCSGGEEDSHQTWLMGVASFLLGNRPHALPETWAFFSPARFQIVTNSPQVLSPRSNVTAPFNRGLLPRSSLMPDVTDAYSACWEKRQAHIRAAPKKRADRNSIDPREIPHGTSGSRGHSHEPRRLAQAL